MLERIKVVSKRVDATLFIHGTGRQMLPSQCHCQQKLDMLYARKQSAAEKKGGRFLSLT